MSGVATKRTGDDPIAMVRITRSVLIRWLAISTVGFFAFTYGFAAVAARLGGSSLEPIVITGSGLPIGGVELLAAIGSVALVVIAHELLHGAFMTCYGDVPSYGVGISHFFLPYAYAHSGAGHYTRNQLLVVLLAPVSVITAVGVIAMVLAPSPLWILPLAANAAGSVGDLWMASVLWQYPADARVGGHPTPDARGFAIYYSPTPTSADSNARRPIPAAVVAVVWGSAGTVTLLTIALMGLVFTSLAVGSGTVVVEPNGWLLLRHVLRADGGVVLEIGGSTLLGLALVGGLAWAFLATTRATVGERIRDDREP